LESKVNVLKLDYCILPIHCPDESHWTLAVFCFPDSNIALYDRPTQTKNSQVKKWQDAKGADIINVCILVCLKAEYLSLMFI